MRHAKFHGQGRRPIGLGTLLVLQNSGYNPVEVFDPNAYRRAVSGELGGIPLHQLDAGARYRLVLECSGKDAARQGALEMVAACGAVIQSGEADARQVNETIRGVNET